MLGALKAEGMLTLFIYISFSTNFLTNYNTLYELYPFCYVKKVVL